MCSERGGWGWGGGGSAGDDANNDEGRHDRPTCPSHGPQDTYVKACHAGSADLPSHMTLMSVNVIRPDAGYWSQVVGWCSITKYTSTYSCTHTTAQGTDHRAAEEPRNQRYVGKEGWGGGEDASAPTWWSPAVVTARQRKAGGVERGPCPPTLWAWMGMLVDTLKPVRWEDISMV